jgi:hypothetical protein
MYPIPININAAIHECTILNEVASLKTRCGSEWTGFNNTTEICILKGKYPEKLIKNWNDWNDSRISDNSTPGSALIVLRRFELL